jgi:ribosomal protein L18E
MPLQRRVPKRGFKNIFKVPYQVVNLKDLERVKEEDINKEILEGVGLIRSAKKPVKLLGIGDIQRILNVTVDAFSVSARRAIEDAGGKCITIEISRARIRTAKATSAGKAPEAEQPAREEQAVVEEPAAVEEQASEEEPAAVEEQASEEERPVEDEQASEEEKQDETEPEDEAK